MRTRAAGYSKASVMMLCFMMQSVLAFVLGAPCQGMCIVYFSHFVLYPLPKSREGIGELLFAFLLGLWVDLLYNTWGVHSSSLVVMVYSQSWFCGLFFGPKNSSSHYGGWRWSRFILWTLICVAIYHICVWFFASWELSPHAAWLIGKRLLISWIWLLVLRLGFH